MTEWRARRTLWRQQHPALVVRRGARRILDDELARASNASVGAAAFARYLAALLGGPPAGLTLEEALPLVRDETLAERLAETMTRWEAAYLGGAELPVEQLASEARRLADDLERLKR